MRKTFIILFLMIFITNNCYASVPDLDLEFGKEILTNSSGYKSITLEDEIYRYAKEDLSDIRIVNQKNEFIPYYIESEDISKKEVHTDIYYSNKVLKFIKDDDTYFDFELIKKSNNEDFIVNQLVLDVTDINFAKDIKVYGSFDNIKWEYIKNDNIFIVPSGNSKTNIEFSEGLKYSFYRISVLKNIENIEIKNILALNKKKEVHSDIYTKEKSIKYDISQEDKKTILELNNDNKLKMYRIELLSDDTYYREYSLYKDDYIVDTGVISNANNGISLYKYMNDEELKLVINNKDDKPITIKDIKINYYIDKVVFKAEETDKYHILFGNEEMEKPIYDIEYQRNNISEKEEVKLGDLIRYEIDKENSDGKIDFKTVLNIIIIVIAIFLILIIVNNLKNEESTDDVE